MLQSLASLGGLASYGTDLWTDFGRRRYLRRGNSERCHASRSTCPAADQIRIRDQP